MTSVSLIKSFVIDIQCCQMYDNYRICTIIWPSVRCTINNSKNAQMYDNFGISPKRAWIHYFPWLLIWDLVWLLKIRQEFSQADPRSVLGGIKNNLHLSRPVSGFYLCKLQEVTCLHAAYLMRFCYAGVSNKVVSYTKDAFLGEIMFFSEWFLFFGCVR